MTNPRQASVEAALAAFYQRAEQGRVPQRRRHPRIVGGVVGAQQHQRGKRLRQKLKHWTQLRRYRAVK